MPFSKPFFEIKPAMKLKSFPVVFGLRVNEYRSIFLLDH